jgi:predicted methyltransferase
LGPANVAVWNEEVFAALKPGGVFLVIDHVAESGSGLRDTERLHRIDPEAIKQEVESAGFVLESESDVLRNPADDHTATSFDPVIKGHTDQIVLKFRKPRNTQ